MFNYPDVDDFPSTIQLIEDTDAPNATNFAAAPEGLANRTYYLYLRQQALETYSASTITTAFYTAGSGVPPSVYSPALTSTFQTETGSALVFWFEGYYTNTGGLTKLTITDSIGDRDFRLTTLEEHASSASRGLTRAMVYALARTTGACSGKFMVRGGAIGESVTVLEGQMFGQIVSRFGE